MVREISLSPTKKGGGQCKREAHWLIMLGRGRGNNGGKVHKEATHEEEKEHSI